jgi:hypothetical protein
VCAPRLGAWRANKGALPEHPEGAQPSGATIGIYFRGNSALSLARFASLAKTLTTRHTLEVALAMAEAKLQLAVRELAVVGANRDTAGETLDKARAGCRDARAALTRFDRAQH